MLLPIKTLDVELAPPPTADLPVAARYRAARVLVRWFGVPVGTVSVPIVAGHVRLSDLAAAISRDLPRHVGPEWVRRALSAGVDPNAATLMALRPPPPRHAAPTLSLVICTRDRPDDLALCLAAVAQLNPPPLEVVIVDNAPRTDATARLVQDSYPQFKYILEKTPGLDHARNRGIRECSGEVVAFTDDDVIVDPSWIGAVGRAFAEDPALGLVTGLIEPYELETPAQALFEAYGGFGRGYQRQYLQSAAGTPLPWSLIGAGQLGAGANMAIRRVVFETTGFFDPALDVGTPTRGGGDHEMFHRVIKSGWLCLYEPAALVRHRHRRTLPELERLLYDYGHATRCFFERVRLNFPEDQPGLRRLQKWWWKHWAWKRLREAVQIPTVFPPRLVRAEIRGYREGAGGYERARRQIVPDEAVRPDAFRRTTAPPRNRVSTHLIRADLAQALRAAPEGRDSDALEVMVERESRLLGSVRVATMGHAMSARRLADAIARELWTRVLRPSDGSKANAWADIAAKLAAQFPTARAPSNAPTPGTVTVVVATCNRPDNLRNCLLSLQRLRTARPVQIVVVDNRPAAGSATPVVREFPGVELVEEPRPGSSYARNAGIAAARGEFIAMTDDDMRVDEDWLERLLVPFARADVVAVTGNTLPARVETAAERHFETYGGFGRGFEPAVFDTAWFQRFRRRAVPTWHIGGSGNAAFRTSLFSDPTIGLFDERLGSGVPTGVGEDTKLFYDILHAGSTIVYEPAAIAWHHHRVTMAELRRQLYGYSKGHVAYHLLTFRHHRDLRALVRIGLELPLDFVRRLYRRALRRYPYPWRLLLTEIAGFVMGPWSLWAAHRHARRFGRSERQPLPTRVTTSTSETARNAEPALTSVQLRP